MKPDGLGEEDTGTYVGMMAKAVCIALHRRHAGVLLAEMGFAAFRGVRPDAIRILCAVAARHVLR